MGAPRVLSAYIETVADPSTTPKRYHHGDLRRALVQTTRTMLREAVIHDLSMRELARRLNVSSRAPYRHFDNKEALMSAVAADGFRELRESLKTAALESTRGQELEAQSRAYVRFALAEPALFRLMFSYRMSEADAELLAEKRATKILLAQRAAANLPDGQDIEARALGCWSLVHGLAILLLDGLALERRLSDENEIIQRVIGSMLGP